MSALKIVRGSAHFVQFNSQFWTIPHRSEGDSRAHDELNLNGWRGGVVSAPQNPPANSNISPKLGNFSVVRCLGGGKTKSPSS